MSLAFQERFKDRVSAVGKQGELELSRSTPIKKDQPTALQQSGVAAMQSMHQSHASLTFASLGKKEAPQEAQFARPIRVFQNRDAMKPYDSISVPRMTPVSSNVDSALSLYASEVQSLEDFRPLPSKSKLANIADSHQTLK